MILLTFSKTGREDVVLTEDDLFDFEYDHSCFSGETFELGGVNARSLYLVIDNNTQRFSRGTFANTRVLLEIDGNSYGYFNVEQPKRRNGIIELTAYDDMIKLDVEYPSDYVFPQVFWSVYAQCLYEAGLADDLSFDNIVNNGVFDNGVITTDYTDYIYANSCRQLVSGMAEWNGGFCFINDDGKLQIQPFSKDITHSYSSGELMELDYSDDTVVFSKVRTSQKNKTYEMGDDSGYTLVIQNQYIQYGLDDTAFELMLGEIFNYYNGFALTPMTFTLAEPDLSLKIGDRISVYDEEEDVTIVGNISKIVISGNLLMQITCGGFDSGAIRNNFNPTSKSQIRQAEESKGTNSDYAKYLQTADSAAVMQTLPGGFVCGKMCFMEDSQGGFRCLSSDGANINVDTSIFIRSGKNHQIIVDDGTILVSVGGAVIRVNVGGDIYITNGTDADIRLTTNTITAQSGTAKLKISGELVGDSTGLKYNGTYIT